MNREERNRFLSEMMGLKRQIDLSTWEGFGVLWKWARSQNWWNQFAGNNIGMWSSGGQKINIFEDNVDPDMFADSLYKWGLTWFESFGLIDRSKGEYEI